MAPRQAIALREIVYQLSPYQQTIVSQAFKNAPKTFLHFVKEKGPGLLIFSAVYFGGTALLDYKLNEEKLKERF
ncbi:ubiquinol:cytochrome c oxidoreductase 9 kDa subunit [Haematococcus lacustris]|nr:hypothetical protein QJQ45_014680 [Haematococcus lacustris]